MFSLVAYHLSYLLQYRWMVLCNVLTSNGPYMQYITLHLHPPNTTGNKGSYAPIASGGFMNLSWASVYCFCNTPNGPFSSKIATSSFLWGSVEYSPRPQNSLYGKKKSIWNVSEVSQGNSWCCNFSLTTANLKLAEAQKSLSEKASLVAQKSLQRWGKHSSPQLQRLKTGEII